LQTFSTFHLCNLWSDDLKAHILQAKFPHIWTKKNHPKVHILCMGLSLKAVMAISCVPDTHFPSIKQNLIQMHCSFK
jgi:hypothetical protein